MTDLAEPALLKRMKELLNYNPETGKFYWKNYGMKSGCEAGSKRKDGYIGVRFEQKYYLAHRLAWYFTHKKWPGPHLDHDNHNESDNRIINLIDRGVSGNALNRRLGLKGIGRSGKRGIQILDSGNFHVRIAGKCYGTYSTLELAERVVRKVLAYD